VKRTGQSVLVVDDDSDWRALVADTLADEGFVVATAANGRAACDCFRRTKPSVVVTDVEMPSMDGGELLAQLRCLDRELPVIVMTADDVQDTSRFTDAFRFIRKPATTDAVTAAVKEALLRRRRPRLRALWMAARGAADGARERAYEIAIRTTNRCRRRSTKAEVMHPVRRDTKTWAAALGKVAVIAGVGVAAVAAVLIAALHGPAA
jgi:DNA-binding NtrC family response regulator